MRYSDQFLNETDPQSLLNIVQRQGQEIETLTQSILKLERLSGVANEIGELEYRVLDTDGNVRLIMSAVDLFDELGVHAHFVGLNTTAEVQFYISSDDGKAYFANGTAYIDVNGITLAAGAYPATAYMRWVLPAGERTGWVDGWYHAGSSTSGLELYGQAINGSYSGSLILGATDESGNAESVINIGETDIGISIGLITAGVKGTRGLTLASYTSTTNDMNVALYVDTYTTGTPAVGLGSAISFRTENSTPALKQQGYIGFEWLDKTAGSEDARLRAGAMIAGVLTDVLYVGTYTPTLDNTTNVAASMAFLCNYFRINDGVFVSGKVEIDPTLAAPTATELGMSLPIASDFGAEVQCGGTFLSQTAAGAGGSILGDVTNNRARFRFSAISTANLTYSFFFFYRII